MQEVPTLTIDNYGRHDYDFRTMEDIHISYLKHNVICQKRATYFEIDNPIMRGGSGMELYVGSDVYSTAWINFVEGVNDTNTIDTLIMKINDAMERDLTSGILQYKVEVTNIIFIKSKNTSEIYFKINNSNTQILTI
jgi:hypothetical protein